MNQATAATPVITAKASPLTRPTIASRITTRNALLEPSSRVASARTATVMVWVAALPPWLATIGASTASATIFSSWPSNRPSTEDARNAVARLTSSQLKRARAMVQTLSDSSSSLVTPPSAFRSSSASSSMTSTTSSMVMTPTSRLVVSTTGAATRLYFAEHPRDLFLVVQHRDAAAVFVDQIGERHRPARPQQRVERNRALPVLVGIDRVDLVEPVRQIGGVAHVVDRLAHGPVRRHRDELRLHPPAGGVFRIKQAALQRRRARTAAVFRGSLPGLPRRGLPSSSTASSDSSSRTPSATVSGSSSSRISSRTASSTSLSAEKSKSVPVSSTSCDAVVGFEGRDQIAEIGLVQFRHHLAQQRPVGGVDGARDLLDKLVTELPLFIPHREMVERGALRRVAPAAWATSIFSAMPRLAGLTELRELV